MAAAFIATFLFALSVIAASRSVRLLGGNAANFWRLVVAAFVLGLWAHTLGEGLGGVAFGWFFLSGVIGFGLGDFALFQCIPRLGPRLSSLMINCLSAPFGAAIEWLWLGTRLSAAQVLCGVVILTGVALSLAPERQFPIPLRRRLAGVVFGVIAGFGQGYGAVLTRKAYTVAAAAGQNVDGVTAAYERILGGLALILLPTLWWLWRERARPRDERRPPLSQSERRRAAGWVTANALAGPAIGVAFYQWALKTTPSGIVLPITAMAPLMVIPFTYVLDRDRPGWRSLVGAVVAVAGVVGLTLVR
ncbi:MAG: DMT family transporter [Verrucomicrobia bacterium]|jgi:drug/metabolite transporter (DMT)-like permease|nr:DMT family transporter [Verrucomicrobiota bacterium]